uniref:Env polyprotein n=1 Tax=Small ruminant lentivirus TaxID=254355 RepID=A0A455LJF3_CAEV|nr:env protein [Small ruminant lentivirus]
MNSRKMPSRTTWKEMEPPIKETWNQVIEEMVKRQQCQEKGKLLQGKQSCAVSSKAEEEVKKVKGKKSCKKERAHCIWIILWGMQLLLWGCLLREISKGNGCEAEEVIALVSDPGGFQKVEKVELVPVTCVTKNFTKWGCNPEGAYPDPEKEYRNISQDILEEVYKREWPWNTYHWPLWQMDNMRQWMKENKAEYKGRTNKTREDIDDLLAGRIRGRFCVPYPYALLKCQEWCWYPDKINQKTGEAEEIKINCTKAIAVSCTENMPLAGIQRVYWEKEEAKAMQFLTINACNGSNLRCKKRPGGCVQGYPIPVGAEIIPESMKYLRGQKSNYGGIKDKNGELKLPLSVRVWVRMANLSGWVDGTPPYWNSRINGSTGINGTRWYGVGSLHHLGYNISSNPEEGICNFTKEIWIGNEKFPYKYKPSWNCSQNWTGHPVWHVFRYLDMVEHMTGECIQRPQRKNITVGNGTITGNCSVTNWDGCSCTRSGNYLYNSTDGGLLVIICRENKTITGIMGTPTNWTSMQEIYRNCSGCENATLDSNKQGTLGGVANINCSLPHKNESNKWTCAARKEKGKGQQDSLYIAGRDFWGRVKAQYSCESNIGGLDGMMHQQMLLQRYQVIRVRAYTYGVVEMPTSYVEQSGKSKNRELKLQRKKRGVGLVIVLAIMAIIAAAGAGLGVANAVQQSYTRTAVQSLANASEAQQQVLEAAYAMVQHVAKGVRILEARVARVEAIVDRMMLYHELDCWHYQHFCVTSTRAEVAQYVNWTRFKDNCTWQQWEEEIERHEANLSTLLREAALRVHIGQRDAQRIPDVWKALQEAFNWSGWFAWLKYIPWIVMGIIGVVCVRILMCFLSCCMQAHRQLKEIQYTRVTVVIEEPVDLEGKPKREEDGSDGCESLKQEKRPSPRTFIQIWRAVWEAWRGSRWSQRWMTLPYISVLPLIAVQQWIQEHGWLGGRRHKNKKERVDCQDREFGPRLENEYVELG